MLREALTIERLNAMEPDEVAAYFVARRAEGLTEQEEELFSDWLASDPGSAAAVRRADRAWDVFAGGADNEILAAMRTHALAVPVRPKTRWTRNIAAAAAVLLVAFVGTMTLRNAGGPAGNPAAQPVSYVSAHGEVKTIALPDGSRMILDSDSKAVGRFGEGARAVELVEGRAFFEVKKGLDHQFSVNADGMRIVALGTKFEVDATAKELEVTLLEGRVAVEPRKAGGKRHVLMPGQRFVETPGGGFVEASAQDAMSPGWSRGLIELDDRPLGEAISEMNRYSREQVIIRDPGVASLRVSGQFQTGDAPRFARSIAEIYPVRVVSGERGVEMVSK